MLSFFNYYYLY